ncbi:MAG: right-handed parallel beta-helix repeat-containing protein [Deltaproteobacteria bacterium]|nr:right-handed parallel beta-helix repeat-containing protein [Deltaproteobacteria bacterium]
MSPRPRRLRALPWTLTLTLAPAVGLAELRPAGPADYCAVLNGAAPGDEVVLQPGRYTTPCGITASGAAGRPLVLRAASEADGMRPVFAYTGRSSNVLDLRRVRHVTLRGLTFEHTEDSVDTIKLHASDDVTIERCAFRDIGGVTISALDGDCARLTVRDCTLRDVRSTAIYLGCHDGRGCHATEALVERTLIDGTLPGDGVGYGVQLKLNSYGTLRDNTVYRTRGPGLMVYGSDRGDPPSILEGNYVHGSVTDACILVGGGPAVARNNVVEGCGYAGLRAQNYAGRGLQRRVWLVHNTVIDSAVAGVRVEAWAPGAGNVLAFNAIVPRAGVALLDPASPAAEPFVGNAACPASAGCFEASPAPYDLRPRVGGPLYRAAGAGSEPWRPTDDFLGAPRGPSADIGALQRRDGIPGPRLGGGAPRPPREPMTPVSDAGSDASTMFNDALDTVVDVTKESPTMSDGAAPATPPSGSVAPGGCGCGAGRGAGGPALALLALGAVAGARRRRGRGR